MNEDDIKRLQNRVDELEMIVSYQDDLLEKFSTQLYEHDQKFEKVLEEYSVLKEQVAQGTSTEVDNRRPPHY